MSEEKSPTTPLPGRIVQSTLNSAPSYDQGIHSAAAAMAGGGAGAGGDNNNYYSEDHDETPDHSASSRGSSAGLSNTPFFADAMLDLEEAHDIAETPEPVVRPIYNLRSKQVIEMPVLSPTFEEVAKTGSGDGTGAILDDKENDTAGSISSDAAAGSTRQQPLHLRSDTNNASSAAPHGSSNNRNGTTVPTSSAQQQQQQQQFKSPTSSSSVQSQGSSQLQQHQLARITSGIDRDVRPKSAPRWPRDIPWAVAFLLLVPTSLMWPLLKGAPTADNATDGGEGGSTSGHKITLSQHPLSTQTMHALIWSMVATLVLSRLLYNSLAAGDGDHARYRASQFILLCAPSLVAITALLALFLWWSCPKARVVVIIPLWFLVHDLYFFRRWKQRSTIHGGTSRGGVVVTHTESTTRQAFFQALVCMALDILSRSLRRASFLRVLSGLLVVQFGVILWWRYALLAALRHLNAVPGAHNMWVLIAALVGGKWATGTVTRLLTLLACGGVTGWFLDQSALLRELPTPRNASISATNNSRADGSQDEEDGGNDAGTGTATAGGARVNTTIPEAYRTVDASVYQSVLEMDDALDDDFEMDEEEELLESPSRRQMDYEYGRRPQPSSTQQQSRSTVKSILWAGVTVSFGSVTQCGLLGGLAQFIWSQIRKVEGVRTVIAQRRQQQQQGGGSGGSGFQGMQVGNSYSMARRNSGPRRCILARTLCARINQVLRGFVTRYSDLAMSHVAAYYKNYHRAAKDVAALVEQSGVEPILHDDITTHLCACVGGAITGVIVLITGYILVHQRTKGIMTDWQLAENILLSFVLSYTLIFTVMEPLRASVKAVYVSFAQHPQSLCHAFPLIYHRLCRLSESTQTVA